MVKYSGFPWHLLGLRIGQAEISTSSLFQNPESHAMFSVSILSEMISDIGGGGSTVFLSNPDHTSQHKLSRIHSCFSSIQFSRSVVSNSLWPHESQHARPPCLSPAPGVHSYSRPSSQWCHPAISSSVVPFSSCPQYLPASESFPMSQLFAWGGQSIGVSASSSVLPVNTRTGLL